MDSKTGLRAWHISTVMLANRKIHLIHLFRRHASKNGLLDRLTATEEARSDELFRCDAIMNVFRDGKDNVMWMLLSEGT